MKTIKRSLKILSYSGIFLTILLGAFARATPGADKNTVAITEQPLGRGGLVGLPRNGIRYSGLRVQITTKRVGDTSMVTKATVESYTVVAQDGMPTSPPTTKVVLELPADKAQTLVGLVRSRSLSSVADENDLDSFVDLTPRAGAGADFPVTRYYAKKTATSNPILIGLDSGNGHTYVVPSQTAGVESVQGAALLEILKSADKIDSNLTKQ